VGNIWGGKERSFFPERSLPKADGVEGSLKRLIRHEPFDSGAWFDKLTIPLSLRENEISSRSGRKYWGGGSRLTDIFPFFPVYQVHQVY